jgi:cytochrome c oxidase subunit III
MAELKERRFFKSAVYSRRNPYPLMLWLALGGSTIIFLFIVFMLMVRKFTTGLPDLELPVVFYFSCVLATAGSGTLTLAMLNFKAERYRYYLNWAGITLCIGLIFLLSQLIGWFQVWQAGARFNTSMAAAFLFLLSGMHFMHMIAAIGMLFWTVLDASRNRTYVDGFIQSLNPAKRTRMDLTIWFWHFVDGLWLALFGLMYFVL